MNLSTVLFILGLIFLSSCSSYHNVSMITPKNFDKQHELSANGSFGTGGYNLSLAYSPINHFYVHGLLNNKESNYKKNYSHQYGIGGYYNTKQFKFEAELGYGNGRFDWGSNTGNFIFLKGAYNHFYLSTSSTFNNFIGMSLTLGNLNPVFTYESSHKKYYEYNKTYPNQYIGGQIFLSYPTKFGLSFYSIFGADYYTHSEAQLFPLRIGIGMKYNLSLLKKN